MGQPDPRQTRQAPPGTIAVVAPSPVPFRTGGAERLWAGLITSLADAGHKVELIKLPARELDLADLLGSYGDFAHLDLTHFDAVVSGKYPAWAVDHPRHILWMLHPLRGLYDRWPAHLGADLPADPPPALGRLLASAEGFSARPDPATALAEMAAYARELRGEARGQGRDPSLPGYLDIPGAVARAVIHALDRTLLSPRRIERHAAISAEVAHRPQYFPSGIVPEVILPPLTTRPTPSEPPTAGEPVPRTEGRFLAVGRLEPAKRFDLAIQAVLTLPDATLDIVGEGSDSTRLGLAAGVTDRIRFHGHLSDSALELLYATSDALIFTADREDFGYVALEAMTAGLPVIATQDCGGAREIVVHDSTGLITAARPDALAAAMGRLLADPRLRSRLAASARERAGTITWETALSGLLATDPPPPAGGRPKITALSTYAVHDRVQGGPRRVAHLLSGLGRAGLAVEIISLTHDRDLAGEHELADGVTETTVLISPRARDAETEMRLVTGQIAVTDIASARVWSATPAFVRAARRSLADADAVVLVQPYLAAAARDLRGRRSIPFILDAHNHEGDLKRSMLPHNAGGRWLISQVDHAERLACSLADVLTVTTPADAARFVTDRGVDAGRIQVVPNGADTSRVEFVTGSERRRRREELTSEIGRPGARLAVFVGSGHHPNIEAGRQILRLAPSLPEVCFALLGRHADSLSRGRVPANTILQSRIEDAEVDRYLAAADVGLNPMATGSGSNLKLISYFAAGTPVITSRFGARGVDGAEALCVVTDTDLAAAVRELLADPDGADARARAAREFAQAHLDWQALGDRFAHAVTATLPPEGRPSAHR